MKKFLIATTMFVAASTAYAQDPQTMQQDADNDAVHAVARAWDNADLDRGPYTDDHAWIETNVYGSGGAELGEIERVRLTAEGDVDAIVVEYGGILEIGGREVLIEAGDYALTTIDGENRVELSFDRAAFEALPDFNEDAASEYPLSDDDYNDNEAEAELAMSTTRSDSARTVQQDADNDLVHAAANAWDNADLDRGPYTDDHGWIDTTVYASDGAELGEVERVRLTSDGEVEAIVVEHGGFLEIGGRETLVEAGGYTLTTVDDEGRIVLVHDSAAFAALPDFNEDAASEYPLSDSDYNDDETELESPDDESGS
ncbi:PRC-barrel domain-containing protein [Maricaulis sp.]|uniref:PRC-barrel domain-containing protein n=1 Tax=Maricaulis sp. TaxID=1486257 RepID=UPI003A947723